MHIDSVESLAGFLLVDHSVGRCGRVNWGNDPRRLPRPAAQVALGLRYATAGKMHASEALLCGS